MERSQHITFKIVAFLIDEKLCGTSGDKQPILMRTPFQTISLRNLIGVSTTYFSDQTKELGF